jgi:DNA adenine methylase
MNHKPFLKWVGGKTQIIDTLLNKIPKEMNNYHEPFVGGGSVLLAVLSMKERGEIKIKGDVYACDLNEGLINVYKHIQKSSNELFNYIETIINEYDELNGDEINRKPQTLEQAKTSKESYYYWLRNKFNNCNKESVEYSALFMIINKLCFRGIYREGPNGFNVPYGHYKKTPTIITKEDMNRLSELLKDVKFICCDFIDAFKKMKKNDFVYFDPPYAPENPKSFVKYLECGFDLECHEKLFDNILELNKKKIKYLLSNAKVDMVLDKFSECKIDEITARRAINSKNPESTTKELIIYRI